MQWWHGLVAAAVALLAAGAKADVPPPIPAGTRGDYGNVRAQVDRLGEILGWSSSTTAWFRRFAQVQAWSESRGNSAAANRTASEASAAGVAYDRNRDRMPSVTAGTPRSEWTWGSGGWYGFLPANGLWAFRGDVSPGDVGPYDVFDPWRSTVMLGSAVQRLMRWRNYRDLAPADQVAYALKRGMASPTLMDNVSGHARGDIANRHLDQAVAELGIPAAWKRERVPAELRDAHNWWDVLQRGEA